MTTTWQSVLNQYLAHFDTRTATALEHINQLLLQSGQIFDDQIKNHIKKNVKNRLDLALDLIGIQNRPKNFKNEETIGNGSNCESKKNLHQMNVSNEKIEIDENIIKVECISSGDDDDTVDMVSSSFSPVETETVQPMTFERIVCRQSMDSNVSMCSPSTSNQPIMSPIDTPDSSPMFTSMLSPIETPESSPDINEENIKEEPNGMAHDEMILNKIEGDDCVFKIEDLLDINNTCELLVTTETNSNSVKLNEPPQSLKRQLSQTTQNESVKRQKITEEIQLNESIDDTIVFACFYCNDRTNIYVKTFEEVIEHWRRCHSSESLRFIASKMGACFYCDKIDIFSKLKAHHQHCHNSKRFIVVDQQNRSKCALCHKIFSTSEMTEHFKAHHDSKQCSNIINPICFTQTEIEQLLKLHSSHTKEIVRLDQIIAYKCGNCNELKKTNEISFMQHIEQDRFDFFCSMCPPCNFAGKNIREIIQHEMTEHKFTCDTLKHANYLKKRLYRHFLRTKIIFLNGLVLYKHNMLGTTFDDQQDFWPIKERITKQKLEEFATSQKSFDSREPLRDFELEKQQRLSCNLRVSGIPIGTEKEMGKNFLRICESVGLRHITMNDVDDIYSQADAVIVCLNERKKKKEILSAWYRTPKEDRIRGFGSINKPYIFVENELTPFFLRLRNLAEMARRKRKIFTFFMTDEGFKVKLRKNSTQTPIIWTEADLLKCINGTT